MQDDKPRGWQRLKKTSFNKQDLSRRMRRVEGATVRHARKFVVRRWSNARDVRRRIITWVVATGLLIASVGLQLMWYQQSYLTNTATNGGTYAEAVLGPVDTLNPLFATSSAEQSASRLLFSSLFSYDTSGHLNNDLATNLAIDSTGTVYTVTIRSNALWHDGTKVTANDVAFTVNLLKNPAVQSTITGWNDISVAVVNDTTLTFTLKSIYASFAHALTFPIVPQHILAAVPPNEIRENNFSSSPVGSGPFKLQFVQDLDVGAGRKIIHLIRSSDYYLGASKLGRFELNVYGTQGQIVQALATDEVNSASDLSADNLKQIDARRYDLETKPIMSGVYALLNTTRGSLSDPVVRQALQRGTNLKAVRASLRTGTPTLDLPFINGQLTGDVPTVAGYDVQIARQLLDKAGWVLNGKARQKAGVELRLTVVTTKNSEYERVLAILAGQWRDLGIAVDTQVVDPSDPLQRVAQDILQARNFDVLIYQLPIGADPDVYAFWHSSQIAPLSGLNFSNYSNTISDEALSSARSRLEPNIRNIKYLTFAKQWISDVPAIGLYQATAHYAHSKDVNSSQDSNVLVTPVDRYSDVLDWSVGSRPVYKTP